MESLLEILNSENLINEAEQLINKFLERTNGIVYVVNTDGSTFTLESGCTLLNVNFCQK